MLHFNDVQHRPYFEYDEFEEHESRPFVFGSGYDKLKYTPRTRVVLKQFEYCVAPLYKRWEIARKVGKLESVAQVDKTTERLRHLQVYHDHGSTFVEERCNLKLRIAKTRAKMKAVDAYLSRSCMDRRKVFFSNLYYLCGGFMTDITDMYWGPGFYIFAKDAKMVSRWVAVAQAYADRYASIDRCLYTLETREGCNSMGDSAVFGSRWEPDWLNHAETGFPSRIKVFGII